MDGDFPYSCGNLSHDITNFTDMFSAARHDQTLFPTPHPLFPDCYTTQLAPPPASLSNFNFFTPNSSPNSDNLKVPKSEPFCPDPTPPLTNFSDIPFHTHLPNLLSLEQQQQQLSDSFLPSHLKRARVDSVIAQSQTLESVVQSCLQFQNPPYYTVPNHSPSVNAIPKSTLARQRRQKLSEKTRCLQKLLPWDKKMDMATMFEEAYKYVKFLQAQVLALQSMPGESQFMGLSNNVFDSGLFGGMGRLNRNQLLQVLVNSPVAQTVLANKGYCVCSVEQYLGLVQKNAYQRINGMLFCPQSKVSTGYFHGGFSG